MTDDDVVQFLIEEAVYEHAELAEAVDQERRQKDAPDPLQDAKDFAAGRR